VALPPLFRPHLRAIAAAGRARGQAIRERGARGITIASLLPLALLVFLVAGWVLAFAGPAARDLWVAVWVAYAAALGVGGALAALRFQSIRVGTLALVGVAAVHFTYAVATVRGVLRPA